MISNDQDAHVNDLRFAFREHADAAREYDRLADQLVELRHLYSSEAHKEAVATLRALRDVENQTRNEIRDRIKAAEGWGTKR